MEACLISEYFQHFLHTFSQKRNTEVFVGYNRCFLIETVVYAFGLG